MELAVTIFPDTNSLLHYPLLKDVDWRKVANAKDVTLVFCMQVIHELDEKKAESRLASRAERAIKEIRTIRSAGGSVRDGVTLRVFNHELQSTEFPSSLSPDSKDDRIVHLVKKYAEAHPGEAISVYTEDLGMMLRCETHGIAVIEPDKSKRLESPQTDLERKYKEAVTELNAFKSAAPKLNVQVLPGIEEDTAGAPLVRRLRRVPAPEDVEEAVARERAARQLPQMDEDLAATLSHVYDVSPEEGHRYRLELERYLTEFRTWVERMNDFKRSLGPFYHFRLEVRNDGGSPGEDVEIIVELPPLFRFILMGGKQKGNMMHAAPKPPTPPKRPRSRLEELKESMSEPWHRRDYGLNLPAITGMRRGAPSFAIAGDASHGFGISLSIPKLLHHKPHVFQNATTMFLSANDVRPFQADVAITAANLPHKTERQISFLLDDDD